MWLFNKKSIEEHFTTIFEKRRWPKGFPETASGAGSTLRNTERIRIQLPMLLANHKIKTMVDAPCGDFNWMKEVDLNGITYAGVDIVADIVRKNRDTYGNEKRTFHHADITTESLPIQPDLILCRDCFVHLTNDLIQQAISNFKRSGSTYLLTTTFPNLQKNSDLRKVGRWRPINLRLPPFNFPSQLDVVDDVDQNAPGKALGLWRL